MSAQPWPVVRWAVIVVVGGFDVAGVIVNWLLWDPPGLIVTVDGDTVYLLVFELVSVIETAEGAEAVLP